MHNICVIDDDIPVNGVVEVDDRERISQGSLEKLLASNQWNDINLKALLSQLVGGDEWYASAFVSPDIYLNAIESGWPKPDVIVFDWEYRAATAEPGALLVELLERSFAPIFIYTGVDQHGDVEERLSQPDLKAYSSRRLFLLKKEEQRSSEELLRQASELYAGNFSFRVAARLRRALATSVETILITLGAYHIDFVKEFLNEQETRDTDIKSLIAEKLVAHVLDDKSLFTELTQAGLDNEKAEKLLTLVKSKFRDEIASLDAGAWSLPGQKGPEDMPSLRRIWSYRLYHTPSDKVVRKGDIVRKKRKGSLFLVTTPDCQLARFWWKNCGRLTLIPLWDIAGDRAEIKRALEQSRDGAAVKKMLKDAGPTSLTTLRSYPEGWFVLPYVDVQGTEAFLLGFAKAAVVVEVARGTNTDHLDYTRWRTYERVATLSEPFATPIIEQSLLALMGHGAPDYPEQIRKDIKDRLKDMRDNMYPA